MRNLLLSCLLFVSSVCYAQDPLNISCDQGLVSECGEPYPDFNCIVTGGTPPYEIVQEVISFSGGCSGVEEFTFIVTDANGDINTFVSYLNLFDTTAPNIYCPNDTIVETLEDADPTLIGMASAEDACFTDLELTFTDGPLQGNPAYFIRTWTATDFCLNSSSCEQTITTTEETSLTITCPLQAESECDAPQIELGCTVSGGVAPYSIEQSELPFSGLCYGLLEVTSTVTDSNGDVRSTLSFVDIVDTTDPTIICPNDTLVSTLINPEPTETGIPIVDDNCGVLSPTVLNDSQLIGSPPSINRMWGVEDECGNLAFCEQVLTLIVVAGCTDPDACNYSINANTPDNSCEYAMGCDDCSGEQDGTGSVIDNPEIGAPCDDGNPETSGDVYVDCGICIGSLGLSELGLEAGLMVFPNPAYDKLSIQIDQAGLQQLSITIRDITGRSVFEGSNTQGNQSFDIDVSMLQTGKYLLYLQAEDFRRVKEFVVTR